MPIVPSKPVTNTPPTDEQRRQWRIKQLMASQDMENSTVDSYSTVENPGTTPFPTIRGPNPDKGMTPIPGDRDLLDLEQEDDLKSVMAVSLEDRSLLAVDSQLTEMSRQITTMLNVLQSFRSKIVNERETVKRVDEMLGILRDAIHPWYMEMDQLFTEVLNISESDETNE